MNPLPAIKRFLRKPAVILGELAAIALVGALGAAMKEWQVFSSVWFLTVTALTTVSLSFVILEQFRRLRAGWRLVPAEAHFQNAPFRAEIERPATAANPSARIWSERRLGLAGSLVFHSGLLLLILAGVLRALFATDAATDLIETETLAPQAAAWAEQFPGVIARPFSLDREITLREVKSTSYAGGDLQSLSLRLAVDGAEKEVQVNQELRLGGNRIFSAHEFGPAALVEWRQNGDVQRRRVLLVDAGRGDFAGRLDAGPTLCAYFRSYIGQAGHRPDSVEVRVMKGGALLAAGTVPVGAALALPGGGNITLRGLPFWARLRGSRDSALWLAYAGMILVMAGAAMLFCLIKLDLCVIITPLGDREKVFVALKPQRFAPLFRERFEKFVLEQAEIKPASSEKIAAAATPVVPFSAALARIAGCWLLVVTMILVSGCNRVSTTQAKQLVERYNKIVSEAYRRGDVRLIDPVVGLNEGKKLTGLIGVRLDMGITLDSQLLSLEITGVEQAKDILRVQTKERWSYRDLKIGTGAQVGEASQDSYEMIYSFTNMNKTWMVDEIKFATPPQVGRTNTPWVADRRALHGLAAPPDRKETNQP